MKLLGKEYTPTQVTMNIAAGTLRCALLAAPVLLTSEAAFALTGYTGADTEVKAAEKAVNDALNVGIGIIACAFGYKLFARI